MSFYLTRNTEFHKNNKKIKKHYCGFFRSQNKLGKAEKERKSEKKKIVPMSSYLTRNRKFKKNSKKIQKIKIQHFFNFSSQNKLEMAEKERKKRKIIPTSSYPTRNRKFQKNRKHYYGCFSRQNMLGKAEKERK